MMVTTVTSIWSYRSYQRPKRVKSKDGKHKHTQSKSRFVCHSSYNRTGVWWIWIWTRAWSHVKVIGSWRTGYRRTFQWIGRSYYSSLEQVFNIWNKLKSHSYNWEKKINIQNVQLKCLPKEYIQTKKIIVILVNFYLSRRVSHSLMYLHQNLIACPTFYNLIKTCVYLKSYLLCFCPIFKAIFSCFSLLLALIRNLM